MRRSRIPFITTIIVLLFFYIPLMLMVLQSLQHKVAGIDTKQWTTIWYAQLYEAMQLPEIIFTGESLFPDVVFGSAISEAIFNTVFIGISAAFFSTILGTLAALAVYKYNKSKLQTVHRGLLYAPLILPEILMGISLLICFSFLEIPLGKMTVIAAHVAFCTSYVAVVVMANLESFDFTLLEASRDLGATSWQTTRRIILPLLWPAIAAGGLLAFTLSLDDFIVTFFVAGEGCTTIPLYIYSAFSRGRNPLERICALSSVLLAVTFILVAATLFFGRKSITKAEG